MNCDQVFDILTRGPFPTGTDCDEPVEAHLNECPECRRLAEALRPALELFQEAVDPEESRDLPGYWSAAATDALAVASATEVESRHAAQSGTGGTAVSRAGDWSALTAWRMAAMLAIGVTLGLVFNVRSPLDGISWSPFGSDAPPAPLEVRPAERNAALADRLQLASLPAACLRDESERPALHSPRRGGIALGGELARLDCCSGCHHAGSDSVVPAAATVKIAASCQLCHDEQRSWQIESR